MAVGRVGEFHVSEMSRGGQGSTLTPTPSPPRAPRAGGRGRAHRLVAANLTAATSPESSLWPAPLLPACRLAYWLRSRAFRSLENAALAWLWLLPPASARRASGSPFPSTSDPPSAME